MMSRKKCSLTVQYRLLYWVLFMVRVRVRVIDASTRDFPAVFACLESDYDPLSLGPLLAAHD